MLDILCGTQDSGLEAVRTRTTMTLDDNSLQPKKTRAVVPGRIEIRPQTAQKRQYESTDDARAWTGALAVMAAQSDPAAM